MKKKYLNIIMLVGITLSSVSGLGKNIKHNAKNEINNKNVTLNLKNDFKDIVSITTNTYNKKSYQNNKGKCIVKNGS